MEHNTDRILWTVLILAIGVALYITFHPAANGLLQQGVDKIQTIATNVHDNTNDSPSSSSNHTNVGTNLIIQSGLKNECIASNGDVRSSSLDFASDYIATNGATVFTFSSPDYAFKGNGADDRIVMYDSNKNYLGWQPINSATQTLSKSNVAYIRFSINSADEGDTTGNSSNWLANHRYKLEKGNKATPYTP